MNKKIITKNFLNSVRAELLRSASLSSFMQEETWLNGRKFSFAGHEYQEYITKVIEKSVMKRIPDLQVSIGKPSQLGISELAYRIVLSRMSLRSGTSVLIAMPSKLFAQEVLKTRISMIINESPRLSGLINNNVDSASVKMFKNNSILYALSGSKTSNSSLLNRPIALCLLDEVDRMDKDIISGFRSRQTHTAAEDRLTIRISTPTVSGVGIDYDLNTSGYIHIPLTVCNVCNFSFVPDYYTDVIIPGYDDSLKFITRALIGSLNINQSYLKCRCCGNKITDPSIKWEVERNPAGLEEHIGIKLNPFVARNIITVPDLVRSSVTYTSEVEFMNQGLGMVAELRDSSILRDDIKIAFEESTQGQYILGIDVGKLCHVAVGIHKNDTSIHVKELYIVKLSELEEFMDALTRRIQFTSMVIDSMPAADLVYRLVKNHPRLYSASYVDPVTPMPELFKLKMYDKYEELIRQVIINKNMLMDMFASMMKDMMTFHPNPLNDTCIQHLMDMRRVRDYEREEIRYKWVKSEAGNDHFFHTLIYMFMAGKLAAANIDNSYTVPVKIARLKNNN